MGIRSLYSYIGQTSEIRKAEAFWSWFTANKSNYLFLHQVEMAEKQRLMEAFMTSLHLYNEHLFFEIGGHPGDAQLNLIITAEGVASHFPAVELLTELAPELKDWNVIAFKPAFEGDFQLELPGRSFDPRNITVIPLHSEKDKNALGFQVCYPEFTKTNINLYQQATYLLLERLLGEKSASLDIDYLEVVQPPDTPTEYESFPLSRIREYIARRKNPY
jgi:hypothetical protein